MKFDPKRYHRGDQVIRQWKIVKILLNSPTGLTVPEIVNTLGVGILTAYPDCEQLQQAGFPLYHIPGEGRGPGSWHVAGSELTKRERVFFKKNEPPEGKMKLANVRNIIIACTIPSVLLFVALCMTHSWTCECVAVPLGRT